MRISLVLLLLINVFAFTARAQTDASKNAPLRPVHTFSIVARDPETGELGVAVQSHWFSVGSIVAWAEAGVGAVATQSFVDPSYGKNGLDLMRGGKSAPDTLKELLAKDEAKEVRQVGMSPDSTFKSCGTSSRLVRRKSFPKRVMRGSECSLYVGLCSFPRFASARPAIKARWYSRCISESAPACIVRNL